MAWDWYLKIGKLHVQGWHELEGKNGKEIEASTGDDGKFHDTPTQKE